jgi:hypothetical protein
MIEGAISAVTVAVAGVLEFLGLEALAERITREEKRDPRNFPPPR